PLPVSLWSFVPWVAPALPAPCGAQGKGRCHPPVPPRCVAKVVRPPGVFIALGSGVAGSVFVAGVSRLSRCCWEVLALSLTLSLKGEGTVRCRWKPLCQPARTAPSPFRAGRAAEGGGRGLRTCRQHHSFPWAHQLPPFPRLNTFVT